MPLLPFRQVTSPIFPRNNSYVVQNYGWPAYFTALLAACGGAILLLAPMINAKSYIQVQLG